jgi:hypothetical protein
MAKVNRANAASWNVEGTVQGHSNRKGKGRLEKTGIRPTDLVLSVVEDTRHDSSFGLGWAQFTEGDLRKGQPEGCK